MKHGVRIVNCARGELVDHKALASARGERQGGGAALDVFRKGAARRTIRCSHWTPLLPRRISRGSTEEAQEIVGVRIVEQMMEYLKSGVAINAVNMPAMTAEQYRALGPYVDLAERLGQFLSHIATGNPAHGAHSTISAGSRRTTRSFCAMPDWLAC